MNRARQIKTLQQLLEHHRIAYSDAERGWREAQLDFSRVTWRQRMALHRAAVETLEPLIHDLRAGLVVEDCVIGTVPLEAPQAA